MSKLFIFSEQIEPSTDDVIDWLLHYNMEFVRINSEDLISLDSLSIDNNKTHFSIAYNSTEAEKSQLNLSEIYAYWYRRGKFNFTINDWTSNTTEENVGFKNLITNYFKYENESIYETIDNILSNELPHLNKYKDIYVNKLYNLFVANKAGLDIPSTFLAQNGRSINDYIGEQQCITKPIRFGANKLEFEHVFIALHLPPTLLQSNNNLQSSKDFETLQIQKYIDKKYELRIFYLDGDVYAMAIFSQQNEKTKIDFRKYDYERPNRTVPYNLPDDVIENIRCFMKKINMNCGSIDMIYTVDNNYVFLEVNPVGQFQWLSHNCNFKIEKQIALYFSKFNQKDESKNY